MKTGVIISATELKQILNSPNLVILDARTGKDARNSYLEQHIKGARFIDLDKDLAAVGENAAFGGRHPLPSPEQFSETLSNLGIDENSQVVVYDTSSGANAAARAWWMLRSIGLEKVSVLDGGLKSAEKEHVEMISGAENFDKKDFQIKTYWQFPLTTIDDVEAGLKNKTSTVIDVRDAYRYRGESEPIDLFAGHIPGADNVPFSENLDENGNFLSSEKLNEKYSAFLNGKPNDLIIHCGSGVTACHTILAMAHAGFEVPKLYVGSWSEWSRRDKEIATETH